MKGPYSKLDFAVNLGPPKEIGELVEYIIRCPSNHVFISWVRDTKICNQCLLEKKGWPRRMYKLYKTGDLRNRKKNK